MSYRINPEDVQNIKKKLLANEGISDIEVKKDKKIKTILIVLASILAIVLITIYSISSTRQSEYNSKLRNMAIEEMDENFSNVYIDVIQIEAIYDVRRQYGSVITYYTVCKCHTVEGKTIWAYMSQWDWSMMSSKGDNDVVKYSKTSPMRLFGGVDTASQVADEFEDKVGDVFVLYVSSKEQQ